MPVFSKKIWAKPSQFFSLRASWRQQQGLARPGTNLSKKLYFQYILEKSAKNVENVEAESKNILTDIRYGQFCEFLMFCRVWAKTAKIGSDHTSAIF